MKRLYIVEDEKLIRKGIRAIAERSGVEIGEIAEFCNGREAYEACLIQLPDLMITDIRMPKMDGINLVQKLKEEKRLPRTLVISGHDDFEYARTMLRCGARDYVLKPVEREKLTQLLHQMEEEIQEEEIRENQTRKLLIEQIQEKINGKAASRKLIETEQLAEALFLKEYSGGEVVACCIPEGSSPKENEWVFHTDQGHCFCLILKQDLPEKLFCRIQREYAGCSRPFRDVKKIGEACEEARKERLLCYFADCSRKQQHTEFSEVFPEQLQEGNLHSEMMASIRKIGSGQPEHARLYIEECYNRLMRAKEGKADFITRMYCFALGLKQFYSDIPFLKDQKLIQPYRFYTAEDYYRELCTSIDTVQDFMEKNSEDYKNRLKMAEAVSYISEHYATDLNMAVVSNHIGMSYNWFSSVFKQYAGSNFVTYLKKIRMEEAKRLLAETDLKIQEVSSASGYENEIHFMKTFKAEFGISPTEYRKSMLVQSEK